MKEESTELTDTTTDAPSTSSPVTSDCGGVDTGHQPEDTSGGDGSVGGVATPINPTTITSTGTQSSTVSECE